MSCGFSPYVALKDGQPLASPELYFTTQVETASRAPSAQALLRGVLPPALAVHDQVRLMAGRFPNQPGEIMVGALVKIVAVSGIVGRVSETKRMLTLIDTSEDGCADGCHRAIMLAQLGQGVTTLPKATEPVVAIGKVDTSAPPLRVTVTELVSGKEAVDARLKQLSAQ
jgi:hypothetical protein